MADRALHIGVDGSELGGRITGVGRYIGEILRAWVTTPDWPHTVTVFVPATPPSDLCAAVGPKISWEVVPATGGGTWWEQWQLPRAARRAGLDVFFAGAYTAPRLLPCPFVTTIHDVSYFARPEWFGPREGLRRRWLTRMTARRAHRILTVSNYSASEIVTYLGVRRDRIALAPPGAPPRRAPAAASGSGRRLVLYAGSLFNRRLVPELIAGFARAASAVPDARLILAGDNRTTPRIDPRQAIASHGLEGRAEWREYVSDEELEQLYASARVFAFLSTYEGFAMTPLEAIAHGVPPVLLDTPVGREIYRDGALFVTPDAGNIGTALVRLLTDDAERARVLAEGRTLLDRYTWTDTAATVRGALEQAAGSR